MRVENSFHWSSSLGVSDDQHAFFPLICCNDPAPVSAHAAARNLVAVSLEEPLFSSFVVVNDACVGACVENFLFVLSAEVMDSVDDVFVETKNSL